MAHVFILYFKIIALSIGLSISLSLVLGYRDVLYRSTILTMAKKFVTVGS